MKRQFLKRAFMAAATIAMVATCGFARQPERGYRGFADWTNRVYHQSDEYEYQGQAYSWSKTFYCPGISTSHGYQFNPWLFIGAGIDITWNDFGYPGHHSYDIDSNNLCLFAEGRTDLQFGKFTPFGDIRIGWNACDSGTVYFSPTVGYRFNWGRKVGINVGIGYTLDAFRRERWIAGTTPEGWTTYVPTGEHYNWTQSSFTFRVGFDF